MRLPVIRLDRFDDQAKLVRALYAIDIKLPGFDGVESGVLKWRGLTRADDGHSCYPFFTLQSDGQGITSYSYDLIKENGPVYTRMNSIDHFVSYARRFKSHV